MSAREPFAPSPAYSRWVLALLFLVAAFNLIDRQIFGMLLEPIKREFGASDTALGLLTGLSFALFYALGGIPIARWADRGVRRSIIAAGLALWSALTFASGFAQTFAQLVLARLGVGVGEAAGTPPSHSLVADYFPPRRRASALAVVSVGASLGTAAAYLVGGWIEQLYGWRAVFWAVGTPGVVLAVLVRFTVREPPRGRFEGGALAAARFGLRDALAHLGRIAAYRHLVAAASLHSFAYSGGALWYPAFLMRIHGLASGEIGTLLALLSSLPSALGIYCGGWLTDRLCARDERWYQWLAGAATLASVPFALLFLFLPGTALALACLAPAAFLIGAGVPGIHVTTQALAPPRLRALASALNLLVLSLVGLGLGPTCVGALNDALAPAFGAGAIRVSLALVVSLACIGSAFHNRLSARRLPEALARPEDAAA